jgi:type IV pilus assembly protein PilN
MRISINLATRPFVELRPLFARLRLAMIVLTLLAFGLGFWLHALNARAKIATAQMVLLRDKTEAYQHERAGNEARMRQPQNQSVLARSTFLNGLFARKSFSWTAVMMDLEHVLPNGVQVTNIEPVISKEGEVSIRLRVTGDRDQAIALVRNLETSQRFVKPRLAGETSVAPEKANALGRGPQQTAGGIRNVSAGAADQPAGNLVEFEIFSDYNPLPAKIGKREEGSGKSGTAKAPAKAKAAAKAKPSAPARPAAVPAPVKPGGAR